MMGLSRPLRLGFHTSDESPATPVAEATGLGSSRFARRYSGNRVFFLFLWVLRCFSSPGCLLCTYFVQYRMTGYYSSRVSPFGYLRIYTCLRLPEAFRSLPRPSSTLGAKASTVRSFYLDLLRAVLKSSRPHVLKLMNKCFTSYLAAPLTFCMSTCFFLMMNPKHLNCNNQFLH